MFKGSIVALVTPMTADQQIDYPALKALVEFHVNAGTDGIVSVGTTGESATLPVDEHIEVIRKTVEYAAGRIPVIAGSGANSTAEAIELSQEMATLGVDGFLSVVPYYNKPQQRGLVAHFETIADCTDLPVLLYNVPGRTVLDMLPQTVAELAKHPKIVGIKDATGDMQRLKDTQALVDDEFILLSGDDDTSLEFIQLGGHGTISVTANLVPAEIAQMVKLARNGQFAEAQAINNKIAQLHKLLFIEPNPVMPKWALQRMGLIQSDIVRLPLVTAELANKKLIEQVMLDVGIITN
ncbi:4-hydroxy-tetrahydrodipicolinate synthase [Neptunicella marina]|uniref:4-hydroxy-tetrahydrodipicolinate synthase n=1 Tax=Neptunicella marina TaxID=2125989 RepID=A0A8J6IY19_9ALTE|nr:4-hydroxy-tetrahydrodipicolinate synthase [Neptunicella marina]MBC3767477.1 4-hydroxy-tetrahydrodipicolinate synthase [Neptunicella marina]